MDDDDDLNPDFTSPGNICGVEDVSLTPRQIKRQENHKEYLKRKAFYDSRKAENLTQDKAFTLVANRIQWLNQKIDANRETGKGFELFIQEREALIWMMDKVKELSEKLLDLLKESTTHDRE